jgi:hypothetical protein
MLIKKIHEYFKLWLTEYITYILKFLYTLPQLMHFYMYKTFYF